ncbi:MAG: T9SS type A sorting domain-containing protein [Crocinitomicaceae bacterium]|nr:T9SS type A sorting domain-containing protein [Crocinitomicaceae bacterium]
MKIVKVYSFLFLSIFVNQAISQQSEEVHVASTNLYSDKAISEDLDQDGDNDLVILGNGEVIIYFNDGSANLTSHYKKKITSIVSPSSKLDACLADLDNNGFLDIIVASKTENHVGILYNLGSEHFMEYQQLFSLNGVTGVSSFNGGNDNQDDIICFINDGVMDTSTYILENSGTGVFSPVQINAGINTILSLVIDLNQDGFHDLIQANEASDLYISINDGNGALNLYDTVVLSLTDAVTIDTFDVNFDSKVDIVVGFSDGNVKWLENNGDGTLGAELMLFQAANNNMYEFALGDYENDGDIDMVFITTQSGTKVMALALNDGANNFPVQDPFDTEFDYIKSIALAHLNGDDTLDLVVARNWATITTVYFTGAISSGMLIGGVNFLDQINPISKTHEHDNVLAEDMDNDGDLDLIVAQYLGVRAYENLDGLHFIKKDLPGIGIYDGVMQYVDLNGDGEKDFICTLQLESFEVTLSDGFGGYSPSQDYGAFENPTSTKRPYFDTGDVDGDGDLDVVAVYYEYWSSTQRTNLYLNNGSGNFSSTVLFLDVPTVVKLHDFNYDGYLDLFYSLPGSTAQDGMYVAFDDGTNTFPNHVKISDNFADTYVGGNRIKLIDVDSDNIEDIVFTKNSLSGVVSIKNYGDGTFGADSLFITNINFPTALTASDLNNDGKLDISVSTFTENAVYGCLKQIDSTYANPFTICVSHSPGYNANKGFSISSVVFADLDNDGTNELITSNAGTEKISFFSLFAAPATVYDTVSFCAGDSIFIHNQWLSAAGDNQINSSNGIGFDSTYITYVNLFPAYTVDLGSIAICNGDSTLIFSNYEQNSGVYYDTLASVLGCDSVLFKTLVVNNNSLGVHNISSCNPITWLDGNVYSTNNNTATHMLTNSLGCDSLVTLNLTILNSNSGVDLISSCDAIVWIDGNTYSTSNSTATHVLSNAAGCDSIVTLNLTIQSNSSIDTRTECSPYTWIDGNTYTISNSAATYTFTNVNGCDSIVNLDLTIQQIDASLTINDPTLVANSTTGSYQWLDCDNFFSLLSGETSQSFTAFNNGNYALMVTENGCIDTSSCVSITGSGVGIDTETTSSFTVFPNPTNGAIMVQFSDQSEFTSIKIYSVLGQIISETTVSKNQMSLELGEAAGVYYVEISVSTGYNQMIKVIKH